jgi:solute carrier family 25 2-oxodicarboxylate transporter 21
MSDDKPSSDKKGPASSSLMFLAGAFSGLAEGVTVQPFDMVKTRFQLNEKANLGVLQTMRNIYIEGGVARFYRGMTAELVGMVPKSSGMYATYEMVYRKLESDPQYGNTSITAGIAGLASGVPEALIVTPTQVIKVRLQAKEHLGRYKGPIDCIQQTFRNDGLAGFYTGIGPTLFRNCVWNTVYFATMHKIKQFFPSSTSRAMDLGINLVSGFFGACFATCFNAPFDVVKSRMQSQLSAATTGMPLKYRYTLPSLYTIYREEGLVACYKGFKPKVIRMGLGGAVAMATFELVLSFA